MLIAQRKLAGQQPAFPAFFIKVIFLPIDDRLTLNHLLVVGPEFFGDDLRKEIEIILADGLGFRFAPHNLQVGRIGHGFSAGGVLGVDAVGQVVNQGAQQEAFPRQFGGARGDMFFQFVVRLSQCLLRPFLLRDVPADAH